MTNYLHQLEEKRIAKSEKTARADREAEEMCRLHFDEGMTYQAIGDMQDPPISRQAVHLRLQNYLKRNRDKLSTPTTTPDEE